MHLHAVTSYIVEIKQCHASRGSQIAQIALDKQKSDPML